jgi:peroxiredoxin Q/BCP
VRELREFRVHHDEFRLSGIRVAGVSLDSPLSNREWVERLALPYPLLSDEHREAGRAFGVLTRIGIGSWSVEFLKRATILIARDGVIAAMWNRVRIRGHAEEVLSVARALAAPTRGSP